MVKGIEMSLSIVAMLIGVKVASPNVNELTDRSQAYLLEEEQNELAAQVSPLSSPTERVSSGYLC